jgi:polyhydroxyalkanoate synthesis regulator phasin
MFEDLKKSLDKGLDVAFMNAEKLAQAAKDLAKEHKLNKEEAKKLLDFLVEKSESARKSVENEVQQLVRAALNKMEVVTRDDMKVLEARVAKLEKGTKKATPAKKPAAKKPTKKSAVQPSE